MVQTTKNILKKSDDAGDDPYLGVLAYRATPVDEELPAPATLLNQRTYRTLLPCSGRLQRMQSSDDNLKRLEERQNIQKKQHDKAASSGLGDLACKQHVALYNPKQQIWTPAQVESKTEKPRSYMVKTHNGTILRRNRVFLKPDKGSEEKENATTTMSGSEPTQSPPSPVVATEKPLHRKNRVSAWQQQPVWTIQQFALGVDV